MGRTTSPTRPAAYAHSKGIKDLIYICSRTFDVPDFTTHPELKQGVVLAPDGSEVLAYNNPVRRFGCVNSPAWLNYIEGLTKETNDKYHPAGIFYDNEAWFVQCYCPICRAKFREYTREHYGHEMELPARVDKSTEVGRAATMFLLNSATAYHKALADYCHSFSPSMLCVPNTCSMGAWPIHSIEEGVTDMPFYERSSHAPFSDSLYAYKLALAAGEGRNVGNLMYLPDGHRLRARGPRKWSETCTALLQRRLTAGQGVRPGDRRGRGLRCHLRGELRPAPLAADHQTRPTRSASISSRR